MRSWFPTFRSCPSSRATAPGANIGDDLARQMEEATELKTSQFADAIIGNR